MTRSTPANKRPPEAAALVAAMEPQLEQDGVFPTCVPGLEFFRRSEPSVWAPALYEPAIVVVARGKKEVQHAGTTHRYDPAHYVISALDLPLLCRITGASARSPYLALRFRLDPLLVGELLAAGACAPEGEEGAPAFAVTPVEPELLGAIVRLVELAGAPADAPHLAPLVQREITYRVLTGPQGARLQQTLAAGAPAERVGRAIAWIRQHHHESYRVEDVARQAGMGASSFHQHFKSLTGMTPLQYQKRLRLLEARRLMLGRGHTAAQAAAEVGYASPSQFSRDYRKTFGAPPRQDVVALRYDDSAAP